MDISVVVAAGFDGVVHLRTPATTLDAVVIRDRIRVIAAVGSCVVETGHLLAGGLVRALALVAVDVGLHASRRAVVVISASLPRSVQRVAGLKGDLTAVLVVRLFDLVVPTGERSHVHVASHWLAA
ncbi:hypothetical protein PMAYCL1PPCAC_15832 [Pristionchus mayeri]|uniref:Uncharacterized protein n=1 Tax=Pristionchus mayeri TaxID=1317129 RepID=A0AAN5CJN3_9BILA|nr:hypothetical protein PMAYCL1PPCAC_15832 [Pristionchus mayeri]